MQPITKHTQTPFADLNSLASRLSIAPSELDINILDYQTYYKLKKDDEPVQITEQNKMLFFDEKFMRNQFLEIWQEYDVEFFLRSDKKQPYLPKIILGANKTFTKVVATIKEDSAVKYSADFQANIYRQIQKQMVKAGIFLGFRDETLQTDIAKLAYSLRIKEVMDKAVRITVCTGIEPIPSKDDQLIYHYKEKQQTPDKAAANQDRGFVQGVVAGDTIIEYIKPAHGTIGRDVKGQVVAVKDPQVSIKELAFKTSDKIEIKETDLRTRYIAKISGYVEFKANTYDIKEELSVDQVSLKATGSILTDMHSDVKLNVTEKDILKDAVGAGMTIETNSLVVEGSVAKGAVIRANDVVIKGQTHAKASIYAQNSAQIAMHLGSLECDGEATIEYLEKGSVTAKKAVINKAIGGKITADEVHIKSLLSHNTIICADVIKIDEVLGTDNRIKVDLMSSKTYKKRIEDYSNKITSLLNEIRSAPTELESRLKLINGNKSTIASVKERVLELKKHGASIPASLLNTLKEYQQMVYDYNEKLVNYKVKKENLAHLKEELATIQEQIFDSKIITKKRWKELNEIKFCIFEPDKREITYTTKENEQAACISLLRKTIGDETKYEIIKTNDIDEILKEELQEV